MSHTPERVSLAVGSLDAALNVTLIVACTANGLEYGERVLEAAAPLFECAPCFVDHGQLWEAPRSVRDLAGLILGARYDPIAGAIRGRLALAPHAAWVADLAQQFAACPAVVGLSADMFIRREEARVTQITQVNSVDIVVSPAAGGRFEPPAQPTAEVRLERRNANMSEESSLHHVMQITGSGGSESEPVAPGQAQGPEAQGPGGSAAEPVEAAPRQAQGSQLSEAQDLTHQIARQLVEIKLAAASLPPALADQVRAATQTGIVQLGQVDGYIARLREAWAGAIAGASIKGLGQTLHLRDPLDRVTLAFERLMGLPMEGHTTDIPRLSGIRELYDTLTGDWERYGVFRGDRVQLANVTVSTMAQITANVLNKVLLRAYEQRPQWWQAIAYEEDFQTMQDISWITLGGFSNLDTVSEGAAYTEKTWDDYAESSSFLKKGNYVGITLEAIDKDDVQGIRAIPRKLGLAAWRTLSAAVSALFTDNSGTGPTLADSLALFHASHNNLGSTALSATSWDAAVQAMFQQAEYHSAAVLGVRPRWCLVPIELEKTAL
ncbi:MAG: hypothetical protein JXA74_11155, partial [Anaerolineae bacterium]|nr:hypothetical protein [Anaerolineae bacterium]